MQIGQLAKRAGITTDTIRYYEREGLLPPAAPSDATTEPAPNAIQSFNGTQPDVSVRAALGLRYLFF